MTTLNEPPSGGFFYARDPQPAIDVAKWINAHKTSRVPTDEQLKAMSEAFPKLDINGMEKIWPLVQPLLV
jgi:hypothetical protein